MSLPAKFRLMVYFAYRRMPSRERMSRFARKESGAMADSRDLVEARRLAAQWRKEEQSAGIRRPYSPDDVLRLRNSFPIRYSHAERGAARLRRLLETEEFVAALGRPDRQPGDAAGQGGTPCDLPLGLASRGRRQPFGADVSGSEPLSVQQRSVCRAPHQPDARARGPDPSRRRRRRDLLDGADRRRRGGGIRRRFSTPTS